MESRSEILPSDGSSLWAGMANYALEDAGRKHRIELRYAGEPPHGDSFHDVSVDGRRLPGFAWGCTFAVDTNARYLAASWMGERYERKTIVVDMTKRLFTVLPIYISDFSFHWPRLKGVGQAEGSEYEFSGRESWTAF